MGSGVSLPDPLPATFEEAIATGYTPEQIEQFKTSATACSNNDDNAAVITNDDAPVVTTTDQPPTLEPGQPLVERIRVLAALGPEQREAQQKAVEEALSTRERMRRAKLMADAQKSDDYEKGLSGTKADTKKERDFANLMAGEEPSGPKCAVEAAFVDVLRPVTARDCAGDAPAEAAYEAIRSAGKWIRVANAAGGVTFFVHSLTNEESFSRPPDYVDDSLTGGDGGGGGSGVEEDACAGLASCDMVDLLEVIDAVISGRADASIIEEGRGTDTTAAADRGGSGSGSGSGSGGGGGGGDAAAGLTPLFVDTSEDLKVVTYFKYKGTVVNLEVLGWSRKKQAAGKVSVSKVLEVGRRQLVSAIKHGKTCCLFLGEVGADHALLEICKPQSIDPKVFERGGRRLLQTRRTFDGPRAECEKMWRDADRVSGAVVCHGDFKVCLVTAHAPKDVLRELAGPLPMEQCKPIVVRFGS